MDYAVEEEAQPVSSGDSSRPTLGSAGDVVSESWRGPSGLPTRHVNRDRRQYGRSRQNAGTKALFGDMLALGIAAAVGIGCGFMFLKLFAPSLLAKLHF